MWLYPTSDRRNKLNVFSLRHWKLKWSCSLHTDTHTLWLFLTLYSSFMFVIRWWRATKTPTNPSSTTFTLPSSPASSAWSLSPSSPPQSAWGWSCTAVCGTVRRTNTQSRCKRVCVCVCLFSLSVLILDVVDSVDLDFYRFPLMFTPPQTWVNSLETSHSEKSTQKGLYNYFQLFCNQIKAPAPAARCELLHSLLPQFIYKNTSLTRTEDVISFILDNKIISDKEKYSAEQHLNFRNWVMLYCCQHSTTRYWSLMLNIFSSLSVLSDLLVVRPPHCSVAFESFWSL